MDSEDGVDAVDLVDGDGDGEHGDDIRCSSKTKDSACSKLSLSQEQKLLSLVPSGYIFSKITRNLTTAPKGKHIRKHFGNCCS